MFSIKTICIEQRKPAKFMGCFKSSNSGPFFHIIWGWLPWLLHRNVYNKKVAGQCNVLKSRYVTIPPKKRCDIKFHFATLWFSKETNSLAPLNPWILKDQPVNFKANTVLTEKHVEFQADRKTPRPFEISGSKITQETIHNTDFSGTTGKELQSSLKTQRKTKN